MPPRILTLFAAIFAVSIELAAQSRTVGPVTVEVTESPSAQLALGNRLIQDVWRAKTEAERDRAIAVADIHLAMIPRRWPDAKNAIVTAAIRRADILLNFMRPSNALEALDTARNAAAGTDAEPALYRRIGEALQSLNRLDEAEAAYRKAEAHRAFGALPIGEKVLLLEASAKLYSRSGRPAEAVAHFRRLAAMEDAEPSSRAWWTILSARELTRTKDRGAVAAELAAAERLLHTSEKRPKADARRINGMRAAIATMKRVHHLD
ncbi:MAG TPA: hypothetical protein VM733_07265 [Thermoanaerobaculia bacterium]|nr:hypothetical protein [Thermoanaerobaculia bacterium]